MKVKELIEILSNCPQDAYVGTFANNHYTNAKDIGMPYFKTRLSVADRNGDVYIGNFDPYTWDNKPLYPAQFHEKITKYYSNSNDSEIKNE